MVHDHDTSMLRGAEDHDMDDATSVGSIQGLQERLVEKTANDW